LNQQNLGLQNAILEAVLGSSDELEESATWIVGTQFPLGKTLLMGSTFAWTYSSSVQQQIDEYLHFVEDNLHSTGNLTSDGLWNCMAWDEEETKSINAVELHT